MSKASLNKLLDKAFKALDDEWARGQLRKFNTYVTITATDLAFSMEQGFNDAMKNRKSGNKAEISKQEYKDEALKQIANIWNKFKNNKEGITLVKAGYNGQFLRIQMPKEDKDFFDELKTQGLAFINSYLDTPLRGADHEYVRRSKLKKDNPDALKAKQQGKTEWFASSSEVGRFKSGYNIGHKGGSTVGTARLIAAKEWLSDTSYATFLDSDEWKDIRDRYPQMNLKYKTAGKIKVSKDGKVSGKLTLKDEQEVEIDFVPTNANYSGSEIYDWGKTTGIKKHLTDALNDWANRIDWAEQKGSNTLREDVREAARLIILGQMLKGKRKTTGKRTGVNRGKKSVTSSKRGKSPGTPRSVGRVTTKAAATRRGTSAGNQQGASLYTVMAMISEKLPETVRKNMGAPRLENQTGAFANSVKMTDVIQTPQGYPSFGYTYAKEPYQVYETGSSGNWTTPERDPRKLIDASIREIAAGFALGRFYTRRQ